MIGKEGFNLQPFEEKFDAGSSEVNPLENERQVSGVSERKSQEFKLFSLDLAQRINDRFMGALPDNTKLSEFYYKDEHHGIRPRGKWREYLQGLEHNERSITSAVVLRLLREGCPDIGSIRKAEIEELCDIRNIGPKRAAFIKELFKAKEEVVKTEEVQSANQVRHELQQEDLYDLPFIHNPLRKSS